MQYPHKMNVRSTVVMKDDLEFKSLEEGVTYKVGYVESEYFNKTYNKQTKSKWVQFMGKADGEAQTQTKLTPVKEEEEIVKEVVPLTKEQIEKVNTIFIEKYKGQHADENTYIGGMVKVYHLINPKLLEQMKEEFLNMKEKANSGDE